MNKNYLILVDNISRILEEGRKNAIKSVNQILVKTYWQIGKQIIEYEQEGSERAEYGSKLLDVLSKDLKSKCGKGFSRRNVLDMRRFYLIYKNWQTVSAELSWSHYVEILGLENDLERSFYEKQCIKDRLSVRELRRQINSALFYTLALSKDKKGVLKLSRKGRALENNEDIVKDPYFLEFLKISENHKLTEKQLEQKIIDNLQMFLLELGKGFSFVGRQYRISLGNTHFYVDLVFYHRILKCFVLIDLKIGTVNHQDVGQMNLYLNYFKKEESEEGDNPPIGIILGTEKDKLTVEYALGGITNNLFVSKYRFHLPNKQELQNKLNELMK